MENDVNLGFVNYPYLSELNPLLVEIRGGRRFELLMERVKQEWEHFEV